MTPPDYLAAPADQWQPALAEAVPFIDHIGQIWRRTLGDGIEYCFRAEPIHGNLYGYVHGGMTATFADHALGCSAVLANNGRPIVTTHLDVNFVSGARVGEIVTCHAIVMRKTRTLCFMRGDIMAGGRLVATTSGIWKSVGG